MSRPLDSAGGNVRSTTAWIVGSLGLFFAGLLASLLIANRVTSELGIGDRQREHFALVHGLLFGALMLVGIPLVGRLLGQSRSAWPGLARVAPFIFAAVMSYVIFEDVRSGSYFETDHALPEIFVAPAVTLVATARIGALLAARRVVRVGWSWITGVAAAILLVIVAMTAQKAAYAQGGMYQLDSAMTWLMLVIAAGYAVHAVLRLGDALARPTRCSGRRPPPHPAVQAVGLKGRRAMCAGLDTLPNGHI
jgi:hypothetical protein